MIVGDADDDDDDGGGKTYRKTQKQNNNKKTHKTKHISKHGLHVNARLNWQITWKHCGEGPQNIRHESTGSGFNPSLTTGLHEIILWGHGWHRLHHEL